MNDMKEKKGKSIFAGIVLIAFAAILFIDKMGIYPELPMLKIGISLVLVYVMFSALRKLEFVGITFPLGLMACMFSKELNIDQVSPWIIILVSVLIGAGLTMIFGKSKVNVYKDGKHIDFKSDGNDSVTEYNDGEDSFSIENSFGSSTRYISVKDLKSGHMENGFGSLTVYLNGTTIDKEGATISTENGFGELNVYMPKEYRVAMHTESGFGKVTTHGTPSDDTNLPIVHLNIENGMGSTDIYFE